MKYINYNNTEISKLSLGTVQFGLEYGIANKDGKPDDKKVFEIINYLHFNGVNSFDTATSYGDSEEKIGKVFKGLDNIFITSKISSEAFLSDAKSEVQNSLKKLNIEYLFGLLLHDTRILNNWNKNCENIVEQLLENNLIKNFGVSIYRSEEFHKAIDNKYIRFVQIPFNIFDQRALKEEWFEKAEKTNKLIFIRSIFLQGLLLIDRKDIPQKLKKAQNYLIRFEEIALKLNMTKNELALNFVDSVSKNSILLFGCDSLAQAKENLQNYNKLKSLSRKQIEEIIKEFGNISEDIYLPTRW